jgi:hypothetical protein
MFLRYSPPLRLEASGELWIFPSCFPDNVADLVVSDEVSVSGQAQSLHKFPNDSLYGHAALAHPDRCIKDHML